MNFPEIREKERLQSLEVSEGKINMVLDTDTYNEVDDQFALAYSLKSTEKLNVEAVYAAPFHNNRSEGPGDGMEKSYREILRVMEKLDISPEGMVFRGSTEYLNDDSPQKNDAVTDLVQRAMAAEEKLYVVAIGAITNVAAAILMEPEIIKKIVVVWLGGNVHYWPHAKEFNLAQDVKASRLIFDCGVPLVQLPCMGVVSHLHTTVPELENYLSETEIGKYLVDIVRNYSSGKFAYSKVIWDIAAIGYLINSDWVHTDLAHSPVLTDQVTWSFDQSRHFIKVAKYVNRDSIFGDVFKKLG